MGIQTDAFTEEYQVWFHFVSQLRSEFLVSFKLMGLQ